MNSRLKLSLLAYDRYGFSLFGSPLTQVGAGGSLIFRSGYNFVDISYILIILRYGLATFF